MRPIGVAIATLAVGLFAHHAIATQVVFNFGLDADQEAQDPPVVSAATGAAEVTFDTDTRLLSWDVSFSGFDSIYPVSDAHFHGPADFGANAPAVVGMSALSGHATAGRSTIVEDGWNQTEGSFVGSAVLTETEAGQLLDHMWYINIHTSLYPAGEIRGQVIPEPASLTLVGLSGLLLLRRRR